MYFEHRTRNAACSIEVEGNTLRTWHGRKGHDGKVRVDTFESVEAAQIAARQAEKRLRGRGYHPGREHAPLLEDLRAQPADLARYQAYAEWLESAHDPRGQLIRMELQLLRSPSDSALRSERDRLLEDQTSPLVDSSWTGRFQLTWRLGFVSKAVFIAPPVWPWTIDVAKALLKQFLQHPSAALLEELTIAAPHSTAASVIAYQQTAAQYGPPSLRKVHTIGPAPEPPRSTSAAQEQASPPTAESSLLRLLVLGLVFALAAWLLRSMM